MIHSESSMGDCTTAILAGGEATRLGGADKGLVPLIGRPLIEWVIDALPAAARDGLLIVANRNTGRYASYGRVIGDARPGYRGPLAGVAAALSACTTPWLLTVPVDCPEPPADLHACLLQQANRLECTATVVRDHERRQPLFALYASSLAQSADRAVSNGFGVARWQDSIGVVEVDFASTSGTWKNLNTAGDFREFAERRKAHV